MSGLNVIPVPCLSDNYAYLLTRPGSRRALVVDPSEAGPVSRALIDRDLELAGILNTHHHWDHVGGNSELVQKHGAIPVCGHVSDQGRIAEQNKMLDHGDKLDLEGFSFEILHIPGHTMGAIAYVAAGCVFTGDTLFVAGCGRLFEGTPADMYTSLNDKLGALPDETRVYCGHEYTAQNLRFASSVEPSNQAVIDKIAEVKEVRGKREPTVPSTIGEERRINPFMRCDSQEIIDHVAASGGARDPVSVLAAVRAKKDAF